MKGKQSRQRKRKPGIHKKKTSKPRKTKPKPETIEPETLPAKGNKTKENLDGKKRAVAQQGREENIFTGKTEEEIMRELRQRIISGEYKKAREKKTIKPKIHASKKPSLNLFGLGKKGKREMQVSETPKPLPTKFFGPGEKKKAPLPTKTLFPKPKPESSARIVVQKKRVSIKTPASEKPLAHLKKPPAMAKLAKRGEKTGSKGRSPKEGARGVKGAVAESQPGVSGLTVMHEAGAKGAVAKPKASLKGVFAEHKKETGVKTTPVKHGEDELRKIILAGTKERMPKPQPVSTGAPLELSPYKKQSNRVIYLTVGLLLSIVVVAGLLVIYVLLFSAPHTPPGSDVNKLTEQPMTEDMAQALAGSRGSSVKPLATSSLEKIPRSLINPEESTETKKFETLGSMFEVSFEVTSTDKATIERVSFLKQGRVSITPAGDYSVQLLDNEDRVLYKLPFNAVFVIMSDPPTEINTIRFVFVLPAKKNAVSVAIAKGNRVLAEKEIR